MLLGLGAILWLTLWARVRNQCCRSGNKHDLNIFVFSWEATSKDHILGWGRTNQWYLDGCEDSFVDQDVFGFWGELAGESASIAMVSAKQGRCFPCTSLMWSMNSAWRTRLTLILRCVEETPRNLRCYAALSAALLVLWLIELENLLDLRHWTRL
jgi:hypothetical protein